LREQSAKRMELETRINLVIDIFVNHGKTRSEAKEFLMDALEEYEYLPLEKQIMNLDQFIEKMA
jgi:hypothetical protein